MFQAIKDLPASSVFARRNDISLPEVQENTTTQDSDIVTSHGGKSDLNRSDSGERPKSTVLGKQHHRWFPNDSNAMYPDINQRELQKSRTEESNYTRNPLITVLNRAKEVAGLDLWKLHDFQDENIPRSGTEATAFNESRFTKQPRVAKHSNTDTEVHRTIILVVDQYKREEAQESIGGTGLSLPVANAPEVYVEQERKVRHRRSTETRDGGVESSLVSGVVIAALVIVGLLIFLLYYCCSHWDRVRMCCGMTTETTDKELIRNLHPDHHKGDHNRERYGKVLHHLYQVVLPDVVVTGCDGIERKLPLSSSAGSSTRSHFSRDSDVNPWFSAVSKSDKMSLDSGADTLISNTTDGKGSPPPSALHDCCLNGLCDGHPDGPEDVAQDDGTGDSQPVLYMPNMVPPAAYVPPGPGRMGLSRHVSFPVGREAPRWFPQPLSRKNTLPYPAHPTGQPVYSVWPPPSPSYPSPFHPDILAATASHYHSPLAPYTTDSIQYSYNYDPARFHSPHGIYGAGSRNSQQTATDSRTNSPYITEQAKSLGKDHPQAVTDSHSSASPRSTTSRSSTLKDMKRPITRGALSPKRYWYIFFSPMLYVMLASKISSSLIAHTSNRFNQVS